MKLQFGWPLCFLAVSAATTTYSSVWHDFSYTLLWMHQIVSATFKLNCCGNWWFQFQSLRNPIWASLLSFCAPDRSLQQSHRRPTPGQEFQDQSLATLIGLICKIKGWCNLVQQRSKSQRYREKLRTFSIYVLPLLMWCRLVVTVNLESLYY